MLGLPLRYFASAMTSLLSFAVASSPLQAELWIGSSSAYGVTANLTIDTVALSVGLPPVALSSGSAVPPYSDSNNVASASVGGSVDIPGLGSTNIISLDTGVIDTSASSNIDGTPGSKTTSSSASVSNLDFGADSVSVALAITNFVQVNATTITSSADVTGDEGALVASGDATLAGTAGVGGNQASISVLGVEFALDVAPAPNTMFTIDSTSDLALAGLSGSIDVFLNEQIETGDGTTNQGITVNAIRLAFNDLEVALGPTSGLLNGGVTVAQSVAASATPEPASLSLAGVFLFAMGGVTFRKHRSKTRGSNPLA